MRACKSYRIGGRRVVLRHDAKFISNILGIFSLYVVSIKTEILIEELLKRFVRVLRDAC